MKYWRVKLQILLLLVFLILPWLHWNGEQLLWLNVPARQFHIFGLTLSAHDAPLIFLLLIWAALTLAFVTSIWGRIWCGWACPQTVFIDLVYRRLEKTFSGVWKWPAFLIVSAIFAHSFAAYFVGSRPLLDMMMGPPSANATHFWVITSFTLILTFNFGWFRENFCVYACPYGRIQNLLMDKDTLSVLYDEKRGEPRRGSVPSGAPTGDCVACKKCVYVCPVKIDIRDGLQFECIGCTLCIDACDDMMAKLKKPKGLIRYATSSGASVSWRRPRSLMYLGGVIISLAVLIYALMFRAPTDLTLLRGAGETYQLINEGNATFVINHYRLKLRNQSRETQTFRLELKESELILVSPQKEWALKPQETVTAHFFVKAPYGVGQEVEEGTLLVRRLDENVQLVRELRLQLLHPTDEAN